MLQQVAEGVLIHQSEFIQSNAVAVHGRAGVLLIDAGITGDEMATLATGPGDLLRRCAHRRAPFLAPDARCALGHPARRMRRL